MDSQLEPFPGFPDFLDLDLLDIIELPTDPLEAFLVLLS